MSFTSALNKAIDLAFDKKENVDPKDPKNWFTMNGAHVLDDGDDRAESATSFIKKKTDERAQKKASKSVQTSTDYVREQIARAYPDSDFEVGQVGKNFYIKSDKIGGGSFKLDNGDYIDLNPSKNRIKELKKYESQEKKDKNAETLKQKADYEVLEEKNKALKLKKDGVEFWVKKSSIREDGSLTPSAVKEFEASKRGEGFLDKVKSEKETQAQFRDYLDKNGVSYGSPSWESEKAIGIDISVDWYDIEKTQRARIFIPKSQLKDGKAPWWLVKKKLQEMSAELNTKTSRYGGYSYDTPFTTNYEGGQEFSSYGWSKINES